MKHLNPILVMLFAVFACGMAASEAFASADDIIGTWEGKDATRHLHITYSKGGRFKLENLRKPTRFAPVPKPRFGTFSYDPAAETLVLVEKRARQSFRVTWKTKSEFSVRNLGNSNRFVWRRVGKALAGSLAGTTWTGSDGLAAGTATFVLMPKGKALYVGGGMTKFGKWSASVTTVTLTFGTTTFSGRTGTVGTVRVMTGTATDSAAMRKGTFTLREKK